MARVVIAAFPRKIKLRLRRVWIRKNNKILYLTMSELTKNVLYFFQILNETINDIFSSLVLSLLSLFKNKNLRLVMFF